MLFVVALDRFHPLLKSRKVFGKPLDLIALAWPDHHSSPIQILEDNHFSISRIAAGVHRAMLFSRIFGQAFAVGKPTAFEGRLGRGKTREKLAAKLGRDFARDVASACNVGGIERYGRDTRMSPAAKAFGKRREVFFRGARIPGIRSYGNLRARG